jgi:hypothetical protein
MESTSAAHRSGVADGVGLADTAAEVDTWALGEAAIWLDDGELVGDGLPVWVSEAQEASVASAVPNRTWTGTVPRCNPHRMPIDPIVSPAAVQATPTRVVVVAFSAEVLSAGMGGHAVLVPPEVASGFSTKRPPVVGTVNGVEYQSRLMVYGGKTYLGLRKDLLRQIGAVAGDTVQIELSEDHTERIATEPPELLAALADNPAARAAYDALPPSHRLEYARWISEAKQQETRASRSAKTIRRLLGS